MSDRASRLQALLQGTNGASQNGTATAPPPAPQANAFDLSEIAGAWRARRQPRPKPVPQAPAPAQPQPQAPARQGPAQALNQTAPAWRQTPDGSLISSHYALEWQGLRGDPNTSVTLRRLADSVSVFDGAFGVLQRHSIEGVWIPHAARPEVVAAREAAAQKQWAQQQGIGAQPGPNTQPGAPAPAGASTGVKVLGGVLALGSLALGGWAISRLWSGNSDSDDEEGRKKR